MSKVTIINEHGQVFVSSREIAQKFCKKHHHIVESIKKLASDANTSNDSQLVDFIISNFRYNNNRNLQDQIEYLVTKNGFSLLALGFTGFKAFKWKVLFISAFESMEKIIKDEIPKLQARILELESKQQKPKAPRAGLIDVPVYETDLFGEEVAIYRKLPRDSVPLVQQLHATVRHCHKVSEGCIKRAKSANSEIEKINTEILNIVNEAAPQSAIEARMKELDGARFRTTETPAGAYHIALFPKKAFTRDDAQARGQN